eukprot:GEMP01100165.1.p1 GENE.GEMP01100165.1~~GEMP01100165.1.p1  ORF type:complete len:149 (+),score=49.25 GEMP01100165.1:145-591(+)
MPPWDAAKEKDFEEVFQFLDVLGTGAVGLDDVKILLQACGLNPSDDAIQKMIAFETGDGSCAFTRATFVQAVKVAFCSGHLEEDIVDTWRHVIKSRSGAVDAEDIAVDEEMLADLFARMRIKIDSDLARRLLKKNVLREKELVQRLCE